MLTPRFNRALLWASNLHAEQVRKGSDIPYLSHLFAVTALVLENGGDEEQAIAALLHDAAEDQGGLETLAEIRKEFGERVARMVDELSDTYEIPKPPWAERKREYLAHLPRAGRDTLLISLADKVHNARSILKDQELSGESVWDRFKGGKEGVLWYYRALADFFTAEYPGWLADELERTVSALEAHL